MSLAADQEQADVTSCKPYSWPAWLAFVYAGLVLPIACFLLTLNGAPDATDWQSGRLPDYASFLLSGETAFVFYPFLAFAMIGFACALFAPRRCAEFAAVRFGLYTGVVLAAQFCLVQGIVLFEVDRGLSVRWLTVLAFAAAAIAVPWFGWIICRFVWRRIRPYVASAMHRGKRRLKSLTLTPLLLGGIAAGIFLLALTVLFLLIYAGPPRALELPATVVGVAFILSLCCAPFWTLAVYSAMSVRVARLSGSAPRVSLLRMLLVFTWLGAYLAAWRAAVSRTVELYAQLPTEPPGGCYIATAAANGHPSFVGSRTLRSAAGESYRVNQQLVYFKCGELAVKSLTPRLHAFVRRVYDRWGPCWAQQLANPFAADAAYVMLKPCEWATRIVLAVLIPELSATSDRLYQNPGRADDARELAYLARLCRHAQSCGSCRHQAVDGDANTSRDCELSTFW